MNPIRRPYRWSVRAYPPHYRDRYGDELIDTALEMHDDRWSARQASSFLANGFRASVVEPRRWWGLAVLFPVLFAATHLIYFVGLGRAEEPSWQGAVYVAVWVMKWLTIPSLPILLFLLAETMTDRPDRWRTATALWLVLGVGLVLALLTRIESINDTVSNVASWRLWPDNLSSVNLAVLEEVDGFGSDWTPTQIVVRELVTVVALALASGLVFRRCARLGQPALAIGLVPLVVSGLLFFYKLAAPWSLIMDFDFFVGDVVLGSTMAELLFFPAPFDPIGSLAVGLAALSMGGLIVGWGRPTAPPGSGSDVKAVHRQPVAAIPAATGQRLSPEVGPEP